MQLKFRPSSLSSDFLFFSMIIFMVVVLLPIGFWYEVYRSELDKKYQQLPNEAKRIGSVLIDSMDYTAKYAQFLGEQIAKHPNDSYYIAEMISGRNITQSHEQNLYTTTFDWVTPDKQLRVSSKAGVLPEPFDMADRDYLRRTPQHPWTFQLSQPRLGGLSKEWIIPAGMGITSPDGKFLGSITLGFSVEGLTRRIREITGESDVHYVVLTDDHKLILDSRTNDPGAEHYSRADFSSISLDRTQTSQELATPFTYNGTKFSYYSKVDQSPYNILVGYDTGMPFALFNQIVLSRLAIFSLIGGGAFLMLYVMRRRLIKPVTELADMADHIIEGKEVSLVGSNIKEVATLGKHLQRIAEYVQNEQRISHELVLQTKALERANAEATAACEIAQRADRAKSEFLANMSHELRTPMNAVVGLTSILISKQYPLGKEKEYLQVLQSSADHLMELINDLLDITKLEAGEVKIERVPIDLFGIIREVADINIVQAKQKGIELRMNNRIPTLPALLGDPLRLRQVLINLVGNAVKFTEKGSVTIDVSGKPNETTQRFELKISIIDTGIGIPAAKLDTIFNKFTQADSSITRTHGGTGLGLSISRMLMHSMHGRLKVDSTVGHGSRFTMTLPLPMAQDNDIALKDAPPPVQNISNSARHILLAEDNSGNILVATCLLATYGYSYDLARNGKEALEKLHENNYDAVLMDVQMPEMDGLEVTRRLREHEKIMGSPRLPIIGMTAYAMPEDKRRCLQAGMDDYIAKPFDHQQLVAVMQRVTEGYFNPLPKLRVN